jgi:outer membrane immunogenic protein
MTKSFSRIAFALLAGAAVAAPAAAQEAKNFSGPFVGVQLGWQQDRQSLTTSTVPPTTTRSSGDGFAYGGQAGYDVQLGSSAVLGVEASITGRTGSNRFPTFDLEAGRTINATARAGWLITPEGLLYARGGYSNARFNIQGPAGASETRDGYLVGAGYEHMLARNVSARVEYNYSDYGNDTLPGIGGGARLNYHRHAVMTGVNFRF